MAETLKEIARRPRSLTFRLLVTAGLVIALAIGMGGLVLSRAFRSYVEADFDERLMLAIDSMVGASEMLPSGVLRFTRGLGDQRYAIPLSGLYWQVSVRQFPNFRSRSLWDQELDAQFDTVAPGTATRGRIIETSGPDDQIVRMAFRDVRFNVSDLTYRFIVAGDTADIREDISRFNELLFSALSALGLVVTTALILQVRFGLQPLRLIRVGLARIRSGKTDRLTGDFPPEIDPLVREVNALLEHNESIVERARTHVGNLAHALKTPLSVISNEAEQESAVARQAEIMRTHIDHHLKRARAVGAGRMTGPGTPVAKSLNDLVRAMGHIYADRQVRFEVVCPDHLVFRGEREDLDEMVGNLIDNAGKWARSRVVASARHDQTLSCAIITIEDDGPGVSEDKLQELFERGKRLDESKPGSGLGLAIVRDIAELYKGRIDLSMASLGGLRATLTLPSQ